MNHPTFSLGEKLSERLPVQARLASNLEGEIIRELLELNGYNFPVTDWSDIYPFWIVAVEGEDIIACAQIVMGKPMGSAEFLAIRPGLSKRVKILALKALIMAGMATLRAHGCSLAFTFVPFENKDWKEILKSKLGAVTVTSGNIFCKKLRADA